MARETYSTSGVDLRAVRRIQSALATQLGATFSHRAGKAGAPLRPIGHYGGVIDIGNGNALTLHTDGVGSKLLVAQEMKRFDTVGIDCVAMTVNDLICLGSEPVALLDYIALEREDESLVADLGKGLAEGAKRSAVAVVGGETAILGEMVKGRDGRGFDLVSMGVGLVKADSIIDGAAIEEGDSILGVASSGLHSNGYTLARKALKHLSLKERAAGLSSTLGEELLTPTSIYVKPALDAVRKSEVHGLAHITGGSFSKLTRLVGDRKLMFDIVLPSPPEIFSLLMDEGGIQEREMYRTFNMGIGLCVCLPESDAGRVGRIFHTNGFETHLLGTVGKGSGVRVNGLKIS